MRSYRVPQIAEGGWQPTPRSPPPFTINSEGARNLGLTPHQVASGRDPGIVAITEEWGDQPSWKAADWGTPISIFTLSPLTTYDCCFSPGT